MALTGLCRIDQERNPPGCSCVVNAYGVESEGLDYSTTQYTVSVILSSLYFHDDNQTPSTELH